MLSFYTADVVCAACALLLLLFWRLRWLFGLFVAGVLGAMCLLMLLAACLFVCDVVIVFAVVQ